MSRVRLCPVAVSRTDLLGIATQCAEHSHTPCRALLIATNFTERMYECIEASVDRNVFAPRANVAMARVDAIAAALIAGVLGSS
jgi:hypothetical protein